MLALERPRLHLPCRRRVELFTESDVRQHAGTRVGVGVASHYSGLPGASAPAWTPSSRSNLAAWWKADAGVTLNGSTVSAWADQSGNGHTASQGTAAKQPTYNATGFNGFPALVWVKANNCQLLTASFTLNQPYTVFIAFKTTSASVTGQYLLDGQLGNRGCINLNGSTHVLTIYAGAAFSITPTSMTVPRAYCFVLNGASSIISDEGTETTGNPGGTGTTAGFSLGAYGTGAGGLDGPMAEMFIYSNVCNGSDRASGITYLQGRYGI